MLWFPTQVRRTAQFKEEHKKAVIVAWWKQLISNFFFCSVLFCCLLVCFVFQQLAGIQWLDFVGKN